MLKNTISFLQIFLIYWLLSIGSFLMLHIIVGYTTFENNVQFLAYKQAYINNPVWKTCFYIHVFSAIVALLAGFTQFSKTFFKQNRKWHRIIGKIYVFDILAINFPAAMILAINANGLLPGKVAFITLDILWMYFTYNAFAHARAKNFIKHRNYMIRSYALTLSAITLRSWHIILSRYFNLEPVELYVLEAWLGFAPNLLIAEFIIRYRNRDYRSKLMPA